MNKLWQTRKISTETACRDLILSRARGAQSSVAQIRSIQDAQLRIDLEAESMRILKKQHQQYSRFREHATITEWFQHVEDLDNEKLDRAKPLLFVDQSQTAKTAKAVSLFPLHDLLLVNCQGLGAEALPCIRGAHLYGKKVIIWEEIKHTQVLANKRVFQSGAWVLNLGDSGCHQYAYPVLPCKLKHVLCTNYFPRSRRELPTMTKEEEDYLQKNFYVPVLPPNSKWYLVPGEQAEVMSNKEALALHEQASGSGLAAANGGG